MKIDKTAAKYQSLGLTFISKKKELTELKKLIQDCSISSARLLIEELELVHLEQILPQSKLTPLQLAVDQHCYDIVKCLLEKGVNTLAENHEGLTAFNYCHESDIGIYQLLNQYTKKSYFFSCCVIA